MLIKVNDTQCAFTLAEVLLTLAIIGVVAALTIPAVVNKVQQDQYVVGLKKAYNTLKLVEREAREEHGSMEDWDWTGDVPTTFEKYFKSHFDILKDCGYGTGKECFADSYNRLDKQTFGNVNNALHYRIITSDGLSIAYNKQNSTPPAYQGFFYVDVNGRKRPNVLGRDLFRFPIFPTYGIKPSGSRNTGNPSQAIPSSWVNEGNLDSCNTSSGTGSMCTAKVLAESAMNY